MQRMKMLTLLGLLAGLLGLAALQGGQGRGRAVGPAPPGAPLPRPQTPPESLDGAACRRLVDPAPLPPEESFEQLFARALTVLPPARLVEGSCALATPWSSQEDPAWEEARSLLVRASARPEAAERSLQILTGSLSVLDRHLPQGSAARETSRLQEALPRLQDPLARIQAATFLVRLELEAGAEREALPRPRVSAVTEYAGRVLELLPLSATAAGLVHFLLAESGVDASARRHYLRGCHRGYLEGLLEPCASAPWVSGAAARLLERLLTNMLALGEATAAELAAQGSPTPDLGVPWESPEAESALSAAWERAGREPAPRAYQLRRALTAAFLSRCSSVSAAIDAASRFYGAYPRFFPLTPDAWPNLAWKPSAVPLILAWIREHWDDPERERGVLDALAGLNLGGGLVDRSERGVVERFFLEVWNQRGLSAGLRGQALVLALSARTVAIDRLRDLLEEALDEWSAAGPGERRTLAEACLAFLCREPRTGESFLTARIHALAGEPALDRVLRASLREALAARVSPR